MSSRTKASSKAFVNRVSRSSVATPIYAASNHGKLAWLLYALALTNAAFFGNMAYLAGRGLPPQGQHGHTEDANLVSWKKRLGYGVLSASGGAIMVGCCCYVPSRIVRTLAVSHHGTRVTIATAGPSLLRRPRELVYSVKDLSYLQQTGKSNLSFLRPNKGIGFVITDRTEGERSPGCIEMQFSRHRGSV